METTPCHQGTPSAGHNLLVQVAQGQVELKDSLGFLLVGRRNPERDCLEDSVLDFPNHFPQGKKVPLDLGRDWAFFKYQGFHTLEIGCSTSYCTCNLFYQCRVSCHPVGCVSTCLYSCPLQGCWYLYQTPPGVPSCLP